MHGSQDEAVRRLTDLRRDQPADATLENLLVLVAAKLELCRRLVVYEYEAETEQHLGAAQVLRALAEVERTSIETLLGSLGTVLADQSRGLNVSGSVTIRHGGRFDSAAPT